jgi:small-conductance mechanosensitive channel
MQQNLFQKILTPLFKADVRWARWLVLLLPISFFALGNFGLIDPYKTAMNSDTWTLKIGTFSITSYNLIHGIMTIILVFAIAGFVSAAGEKYINRFKRIRKINRTLLIKIIKITVFFIAAMMSLNALGIDLTALTIFSGAIGIGLGFGLQKITSNFISGLILLFEKSLEEGDLVELTGGYQGIVKQMGARFTLIETFDSKEIMIPNEDFITNRVTNWTFTNSQGRVEILLGVSYDSDIEKARNLILEAATEHPRCSKTPVPQCFLTEFGSSSVNFTLYFWVDDVTQGRLEPKSDVMRAIWRKFKEQGVGIPFPQSDVYIKNLDILK